MRVEEEGGIKFRARYMEVLYEEVEKEILLLIIKINMHVCIDTCRDNEMFSLNQVLVPFG